jgi:FMN phosphatase YigB (HAD superfamily)
MMTTNEDNRIHRSRRIQSVIRLAIGAAHLPLAFAFGKRSKRWELITVDVFGTLLQRKGDEHAARSEGAFHAIAVARVRGLESQLDPITLRQEIETRIGRSLILRGLDPEFSLKDIYRETLTLLGGRDSVDEVALSLAEWEVDREFAYTQPVPSMMEFVKDQSRQGRRVVAVSDTRYSKTQLASLFARHEITGIADIYSSADFAASKFSGHLFDIVTSREGVRARDTLHIGDNLLTDALSPSQRGIAIRPVRRPKVALLPRASGKEVGNDRDFAFDIGLNRLGPVLVAFTRLLLDLSRREGVEQLHFVARDGELLLRVARELTRDEPDRYPRLNYLHLSRRAMACSSEHLRSLHKDAEGAQSIISSLKEIRSLGTAVQDFQNYYNIPQEMISRNSHRLGLARGDVSDLRTLLTDSSTATELSEAVKPMRDRLRDYLLQEGVLSDSSALVDIGWRGTLQTILQRECRQWGRPVPGGFYFGLWNEAGREFPEHAWGLISDQRRGRGPLESSAWHAAFLLEAVCRANHGMVVGFTAEEDGRIVPVHIEKGATRDAERNSVELQARIQEGVLAYARWFRSSVPNSVDDPPALRFAVQRSLYKLAFFPTKEEIEAGTQLAYSEPTSDDFAIPLIIGKSSSGFLASMRSPWKGGFFRLRLGLFGSITYSAVEMLISYLPAGTKPFLRNLLIKN